MSWIFLALAILLEVAGTTSMKYADGFTRLVPSVLVGVLYVLSLGALTLALKSINISTAYAIWSGAGTALLVLIDARLFRHPITAGQVTAIGLIIVGVVMLNVTGHTR